MGGILYFLAGVLTLAAFYGILSLVLNMVAGWGGMWDLGVAGLAAVGAYTYTLTTQTVATDGAVAFAPQVSMPVGILLASLATGLAAYLIGLPTLRLRGEYFLITTLAFAEVVRQLTLNVREVTRGPSGFSGLDRPFSTLVVGANYRFLLLLVALAALVIVYLVTTRLSRSPFGRLLRAIRDNEAVALSLGKSVARHRMLTFVFGGLIIGAAAPIYVWYIRGIVPSMFASDFTFVVWTAVVVGGIGSRFGPLLGATVLVLLTEALSFVQVAPEFAQMLATARPIILGLLLILVMRLRPQGLISERRSFTRRESEDVHSGGLPVMRRLTDEDPAEVSS